MCDAEIQGSAGQEGGRAGAHDPRPQGVVTGCGNLVESSSAEKQGCCTSGGVRGQCYVSAHKEGRGWKVKKEAICRKSLCFKKERDMSTFNDGKRFQ